MLKTVVIMGVAGSGKTTVGRALAKELGWTFIDADDLHSAENREKMRRGQALTEEDRTPWVTAIRAHLEAARCDVVLACSALTERIRDALADGREATFVYLKTTPITARARVLRRAEHYFPPELVASQFETLEEPRNALVVDGKKEVTEILRDLVLQFRKRPR